MCGRGGTRRGACDGRHHLHEGRRHRAGRLQDPRVQRIHRRQLNPHRRVGTL